MKDTEKLELEKQEIEKSVEAFREIIRAEVHKDQLKEVLVNLYFHHSRLLLLDIDQIHTCEGGSSDQMYYLGLIIEALK